MSVLVGEKAPAFSAPAVVIGEVCPADWHKGDKALKATQEGISSFLAEK